MSALLSLEDVIYDLSLSSLQSWYEREPWTDLDDADLLPNGRPPTVFAIERMYALKTSDTDFLDHLVRGGWLLKWPGDEFRGATALHAVVRIAGSPHAVARFAGSRSKADHLFASIAEYLVNCEQLVDLHAPDCRDESGRTPLHWACSVSTSSTSRASVPTLLKLGADPNEQDDDGRTPLHYAAANWNFDRVKQLVEFGACKIVRNDEGYLPIDEAKRSKDRSNYGQADAQRIIDFLSLHD